MLDAADLTTHHGSDFSAGRHANMSEAREQAYSPIQKASHWGLVLLCVLEFPSAVGIQRAHLGHAFGIKPSMFDSFLAIFHEWAGWMILALGLTMLVSRFAHGAPPLPGGMQLWQRFAAYCSHAAIYLCLLALVTTGAVAMYESGRFASIHLALANIGVAIIALHVVAVIWHMAIRRDGLLWRLAPAWKSRQPSDKPQDFL